MRRHETVVWPVVVVCGPAADYLVAALAGTGYQVAERSGGTTVWLATDRPKPPAKVVAGHPDLA